MSGRHLADALREDLLHVGRVGGVDGRIVKVGIHRLPVECHHGSQEFRRPHSALDFQGRDLVLDQGGDVRQQTQVLASQQVTLILRRQLGVASRGHELPLPPARLHAAAAVGAVAEQNPAKVALGTLGDAHVAVHEALHFEPGLLVDAADLVERDVPRGDDPRESHHLQHQSGLGVVDVHHRAGVERNLHADLAGETGHGQVLDDNRVGGHAAEHRQSAPQLADLGIKDQAIESEVQSLAFAVNELDRLSDLRLCQIVAGPMLPHVQALAAHVDGVSAGFDNLLHRLQRAGGRQDFRFAIQTHIAFLCHNATHGSRRKASTS